MKFVLLSIIVFCSLIYLARNFLGPGISDYVTSISNGYEYSDAGGYEKSIIYRGKLAKNQIVIGARVDGYLVLDDRLLVVRRPREKYSVNNNVTRTRLSPMDQCQYWEIDFSTHKKKQVEKNEEFANLSCIEKEY